MMQFIPFVAIIGTLLLCHQQATLAAFQFRKARNAADGLEHPELRGEQSIDSDAYDVVVVVTDSPSNLVGPLSPLLPAIQQYQKSDKLFGLRPSLILTDAVRSGTLVYASIGSLDRDVIDDVRKFEDAGGSAIQRAVSAGKRRPLLVVPQTEMAEYDTDLLVAVLGALHALYVPLESRDKGKGQPVDYLGVYGADDRTLRHTLRLASALQKGRIVMWDICTSDPERMAPPKVESYIREVFNTTYNVNIEVTSDQAVLEKEYPLIAAVNRGSDKVERHRGRLIDLEYIGREKIERTLFMAGKGITFDTGGINLKYGSSMAGMHRDKCGAAVVAGFVKVVSILQPANLRVVAALPVVRNNVGEEAYTADEVLTARSGVRVRVGNTDAEGRLVLADPLARMADQALNAVNPHLLTIATLTGHARRNSGPHYSIAIDNGPARAKRTADALSDTGDRYGDPIEISRLRREDFLAHIGDGRYYDYINIRGASSTSSFRGHQTPVAFLMQVSGIHPQYSSSKSSEQAIPFTHVDIAGPALVYPGVPKATPLVALAAQYVLNSKDKAALVRGPRKEDAALSGGIPDTTQAPQKDERAGQLSASDVRAFVKLFERYLNTTQVDKKQKK